MQQWSRFDLLNNKDSLVDENSFFLQKWKEKGVVFIQDILDYIGKPFTFKVFQNKFKINPISLLCFGAREEHVCNTRLQA